MLSFDLELGVLCLLCIVLGMSIQYALSFCRRPKTRRSRRFDAPVPLDLGYDPNNPINQRNRVAVGEVDENGFVRIS